MHQYHKEARVDRMITPGQGRSAVTGSLKMWKASSRGIPHVLLAVAFRSAVGIAFMYFTTRASNPPTSTNAGNERAVLFV